MLLSPKPFKDSVHGEVNLMSALSYYHFVKVSTTSKQFSYM